MTSEERFVDDLLWLINMVTSMVACLVLGLLTWCLRSGTLAILLVPAAAWCLTTWIRRH